MLNETDLFNYLFSRDCYKIYDSVPQESGLILTWRFGNHEKWMKAVYSKQGSTTDGQSTK